MVEAINQSGARIFLGVNQPRSQGLSSYHLGDKMRDPGNEVGESIWKKSSLEE